VILDLACFVAFAAIGRRAHARSDDAATIVAVALPFAAVYLAAALAAGVYQPGTSWRRVAVAWVVAWPVALLVRHIEGRGIPVSFDLVVLVVIGAFLLGWRVLVHLARR